MNSPKISVIIVNWNVTESLERCIKSVMATNYSNLELIVIDNNSDDKPKNVTIQNTQNIGFPKAVNQGLSKSTGGYILLLNPDTRIPKDFFVKALKFAKLHPDMGVMGPRFTDSDGTPQGSVFAEPSLFKMSQKYSPSSTAVVNAISGACMLLPKSTVVKIGNFTENVFMYYEDLDYCRRVRSAGLKVYFNSGITIIHEHGKSSSQTPDAQKYLWQSSIWYNGPIKHYLMTIVSWTGQKWRKLISQ